MKKFYMPALIVVIVIQLLAPLSMIANKYDIVKTGEEYRFKVNLYDPYDAFRGRYLALNVGDTVYGEGRYGVVSVDGDGYARVVSLTDKKPAGGAYIKSGTSKSWYELPIDRYYMEDRLAPEAEARMRNLPRNSEAYVTARVKNGNLVITGLYIDGVAIEDLLRSPA